MNNSAAKIILWVWLLTGQAFLLSAQSTQDARVYLHDKPDSSFYLNHPLQMLSQRALDRRARYGVGLDITDVPVYRPYLDSLRHTPGVQVLAYSKWFNSVHVQGARADLENLAHWSFVDSVVFADRSIPVAHRPAPLPDKWKKIYLGRPASYDYGDDTTAYHLHNARILQDSGLTGSGVLIAVIDAGFPQADTSAALQHIYARNGVVDTYNFPDDTSFVYTRHWHGTAVWSVIGGWIDGELIGTAPDADYCLYISEDVYQEMPVEESWWAMAAERADSVGADVINSSLGYIDFDNSAYNHTRDQLGRNLAFVSRAASMAAHKGIHVVIAAGNSGNDAWQKIDFPADAPEVLGVGAVDADGVRTSFSSMGPDAVGRIKPDIMSWGKQVKTYFNGQFYHPSGTSLAAPVITGLVADVVQGFPLLDPASMKQRILEVSDRFNQPDTLYGYGIPDFGRLYQNLASRSENLSNIKIYPNPFEEKIYLKNNLTPVRYLVYNLLGKLSHQGTAYREINLEHLSPGVYWLGIEKNTKFVWFKIIRKAR